MKMKWFFLLLVPVMLHAQQPVQHISQLFDSLKTHPHTLADQLTMKQAIAARNQVYGQLIPSVSGFGGYDYASNPSPMLPLPPNDLFAMKADPTQAQPYSKNIYKIGAIASMPIFVMSLYSTAAMANKLYQSAKASAQINLLKNEAILVSLNANLQYIQSLEQALDGKRKSLEKTKEFVVIEVNNGRAAGADLLRINNALDDASVMINDLEVQKQQIIASIASYTGLTMTQPVPMEQVGTYQVGDMKALEPIQKKAEADRLAFHAEWQKLLPSIVAQGSYSDNFARAYNNNQSIHNDYTTVGVVVKVPILEADQYAQIRRSHLQAKSTENELDQTRLDLTAQAAQLQKDLMLLDGSVQLYTHSVKDKQELVEIARKSFEMAQMNMTDYLKYEDDLTLEQSNLYKSISQKWQTLVQLAVIYGNNIEEIVK
ncbi:MAG: TolC family protein [Microbacter sp.]